MTTRCSMLLVAFCAVMFQATCFAQTLKPRKVAEKKQQQEKLTSEQQDSLTSEVYEMTKSAKTASQFTAIIKRCDAALELELTEENTSYFRSLKAWGLNKRAGKRIDSYFEIMAIGNDLQAKAILKNAKQDADQCIDMAPRKWECYLNRGVIHSQLQDFDAAAKDFKKVCELAESKSYGWFNLAELLFQKREYRKALENYKKSLEVSSSDVQALTGIAHCHVRLKQPEKAFEKYTIVIRMRPDSITALVNRGDAYRTTGQWQKAYDDYSQAAKIAGDNKTAEAAMTYQRAAWLLAACPDENLFQPDTAIKLATTAIEKGGSTALNLETLAIAQAATGEFDTAVKTQLKAIATAKSPSNEMKTRLEMFKNEKPFQLSVTK